MHEPAVAAGGPGVGAPAATARGGQAKTRIVLTFDATREHVYKAFEAVANLADMSDNGKVQLRIEGTCQTGFDPTRLRNAVYEPLDEANIEYRLEES